MELNKEQTVKATKLLGLLCESGHLNNVQVASFFNNDNDEAIFVCGVLKSKNLLRITPADGIIVGLDKNGKTCNAFKTDFLLKEYMRRNRLENSDKFGIEPIESKPIVSKTSNSIEKIKKIHKTTIWIIGGIVLLLTAIGLILDNYARLTKYLKEKESNPKQGVTQNPNNNVSKTDSLNKKLK